MSKYLENEFIELEKFERISVEKDDMDLGRDDEQDANSARTVHLF